MTAQPLTYDAFVELAAADPAVVGLVLKGSRAHEGMITEYSDHDLYVVLADGAATSAGLAIQQVARDKKRIFVMSTPTATAFIGKQCSP